jgi:hypothetical protein
MAKLDQIVIDAAHPAGLARFWAAALKDFEVRAYDEEEVARLWSLGFTPETDPSVMVDGPHLTLCFQQREVHRPPGGRIHLDIEAETTRIAEIARLEGLGARLREHHATHSTLLDPEDNAFCVIDPR